MSTVFPQPMSSALRCQSRIWVWMRVQSRSKTSVILSLGIDGSSRTLWGLGGRQEHWNSLKVLIFSIKCVRQQSINSQLFLNYPRLFFISLTQYILPSFFQLRTVDNKVWLLMFLHLLRMELILFSLIPLILNCFFCYLGGFGVFLWIVVSVGKPLFFSYRLCSPRGRRVEAVPMNLWLSFCQFWLGRPVLLLGASPLEVQLGKVTVSLKSLLVKSSFLTSRTFRLQQRYFICDFLILSILGPSICLSSY